MDILGCTKRELSQESPAYGQIGTNGPFDAADFQTSGLRRESLALYTQ